jgi:hypothetical protein
MIKSREMRWAGHVARVDEECIPSFGRKTKGKNSSKTKMDLRGTGWVFGLAEGRDQ